MYLLNIELRTSKYALIPVALARNLLARQNIAVRRWSQLATAGDTVVYAAELQCALCREALVAIACALDAESVSYYDTRGGHLVNEAGDAFDPEQFHMVSGARLADTLAVLEALKPYEALPPPAREEKPGHGKLKTFPWEQSLKPAPCGCVTPGGLPGKCDECAPVKRDFAELEARVAAFCMQNSSNGHYIGLDRPAWDSPLETGDQT